MNSKNKYENLTGQLLQKISNSRTKDMLKLRFGLKNGQRMTLESIGQQYGITRERVRQIEQAAFSELRKSQAMNKINPVYSYLNDFFKQQGGLVREKRLFSLVTQREQADASWGAVFFMLSLNKQYQRFVESDKFYPIWVDSKNSLKQAEKTLEQVSQILEQAGHPLSLNELIKSLQQVNLNIDKKALASYLDSAKQISQDGFNRFGFVKWPEVNPRGAKDKAYVVLKKQQQPLHFVQVADLINQAGLGKNTAQAQTVHNELIKDDRFVLIGRGTYALREWGYQPGTVKQVISQILKENGPMNKEQIINQVQKRRLVKENTILINLQNKNYFTRTSEGKYILAK